MEDRDFSLLFEIVCCYHPTEYDPVGKDGLYIKYVRKLEAAQHSVQRTVEACRADHDAFQRMRYCPEFCPSCGERLHNR